MSINGEVITISGFAEVILEVLSGRIGVGMVEKVTRIWNEVEMSLRGEVITTSGFSEVILEVLKSSIGVSMVEKVLRIWNEVEMLIKGEVITTSGLCESHFGGLIRSYWSGHGRKGD